MDVYPGAKYEDVALSEFEFNGEGHLCLDAATDISMADGTIKSIEELIEGEWIISVDPISKEVVHSQVLSMAMIPHNNLVEIRLDEGVIRITDNHPLLTFDGEWTVVKPTKSAGHLKLVPGIDLAYFQNGKIKGVTVREMIYVPGVHFTYSIVRTSSDLPFLANGLLTSIVYSRSGVILSERSEVLNQP
jgi:hypothetical protein